MNRRLNQTLFPLIWVLLFCEPVFSQEKQDFKPDEAGFKRIIVPYLEQHCSRCHGAEDAQADLHAARDLTLDFLNPTTKSKWSEVVDVLNSHEMPPEDEPQPDASWTAEVVDWITQQATLAELHRRDADIVLRRLNRAEYRNVIRDLVGIDFDTRHFPQDPPAGGFDNNGAALNLSPMQLELYYDSAMEILDKAIVEGSQPEKIKWRIEPDSGNSDSNRVDFKGQRPIVNGGQSEVKNGCVILHHDNWDRNINTRDFKLKDAGKYLIRIHAGSRIPDRQAVIDSADEFLQQRRDEELKERPQQAKYIEEHYQKSLEHFRNDRMYHYGPARLKVTRDLGGQPEMVAELDIDAPHDAMQDYVIETEFTTESAGITLNYAYSIPRELENFAFQTNDQFARPECWIDWIELEGPIHKQWPPKSHTRLLLDNDQHAITDVDHAQKVIRNFMGLAFRRAVSDEEVAEKLELFRSAAKEEKSFNDAIKLPLAAIMVSPHFLFLTETSQVGQTLNEFELASRLSFFLWSSTPDRELLSLAFRKKLGQPEVLTAQVERMLQDPKSEAFVKNFAGQWLGLREVGANPPAPDLFRQYDRHLEASIVGESESFFREILRNDLSVMNFVDSDFVVINERLARFYGIDNVRGDQFRKVELQDNVPRGGVMTQAAMLTITSNGTRTSPVKRGTWVLKNILGTDPGLPVANAGEIAPKVPGIDKATVRQRLQIHRQLPQCARCHDKIDPLGFALENFDASGYFREREGFGYQGRIEADDPLIDATSQLPDGTPIKGVKGLQAALLQKEDLFLKCLASKLYTYALGRELTLADEVTIKGTVEELKTSDRSLRTLLKLIVQSKLFNHR